MGGVRKGAAADNEGKARAQTVYDAYRDLGGNGHGTQINQDIQNMPIAPSEPTRPSPAIRRGNFIPTQPGRRPMGKPKNKSRPAKAALATLVAMLLALTPATAMADMHGIDVSGWQSDTATCAAPGDFAIVKVTGGTYFTNPRWRAQADCTLRSGKALGLHGHERHRPRRRHDQRHRPYHRRHHRRKRPQGPRRQDRMTRKPPTPTAVTRQGRGLFVVYEVRRGRLRVGAWCAAVRRSMC